VSLTKTELRKSSGEKFYFELVKTNKGDRLVVYKSRATLLDRPSWKDEVVTLHDI
jgi:hypothetical protein